MNKENFTKLLKDCGYITNKKAIELYCDKINNKKEYVEDDFIEGYRWFQEKLDWLEWLDYRRNEMGATTKRYRQSSRMGSDRRWIKGAEMENTINDLAIECQKLEKN